MRRFAVRALETDQDRLVDRAVRSADAAERVVRQVWDELMKVLVAGGAPMLVHVRIRAILESFAPRLLKGLADDLAGLAEHAHDVTIGTLADKLPTRAADRLKDQRPLMEGMSEGLALKLFPAPSAQQVTSIVFQTDWAQRLATLTRLATPDLLAGIVSSGMAAGKTVQEIAEDIRPAVQGVQSSARRVARTEGMRVAHEVQMEAYQQLGDLVKGYQVHSAKVPDTRKWHRERDGTIYYREPASGQKGYYQMPRPPMEAEDPAERPPGTPQIAPNCLCYLTPVLDV